MDRYLLTQLVTRNLPCNSENLSILKRDELECLAILLGISKSGTKPILATRIAVSSSIRNWLTTYRTKDELYNIGYRKIVEMEQRGEDLSFLFGPDPSVESMIKDFSGKELKSMCRAVNAGVFGCKRQMSANLLSWRNRCRKKGRNAYDEAKKEARKNPKPIQLRLL